MYSVHCGIDVNPYITENLLPSVHNNKDIVSRSGLEADRIPGTEVRPAIVTGLHRSEHTLDIIVHTYILTVLYKYKYVDLYIVFSTYIFIVLYMYMFTVHSKNLICTMKYMKYIHIYSTLHT